MSEPGVAPNEPVKFTYRVTGDLWREQPAERNRHKLSHQLIVLVGGFHVLCLPPIALRRWVHFEFFFLVLHPIFLWVYPSPYAAV